MLLSGDAHRSVTSEELVARIREDDRALQGARGGERVELATRLLVDVSELAQGVLDAELAEAGMEALSPLGVLLLRLARAAAAAVVKPRPAVQATPLIDELERAKLPWALRVVEARGFVHSAVHPQRYARAATRFRRQEHLTVLGIRSIGVALGAVVAETAGARDFATVRPTGHPLRPEFRASDSFARFIVKRDRVFAIVDDGPSPSGSSFGVVADWLEAQGVPRSNIVSFPSHDGELGVAASASHRERWRTSARLVDPLDVEFIRQFVAPGSAATTVDVSAGRWRRLAFEREVDYPPVIVEAERTKYLVRRGGKRWLYKFAGLGRYGEAQMERQRVLARRGLAPESKELRCGFIGTEWLDGVRAWPREGDRFGSVQTIPRASLVDAVANYVAGVAEAFPPPGTPRGASPPELLTMAETNVRQLLGKEAAAEVARFKEPVATLETLAHAIHSDNRMQPWEWLMTRDGRVLKCDALEQTGGRGLSQDAAWDVAGAWVELDLDDRELEQVVERVSRVPNQHTLQRKLACYSLFYAAVRAGELDLAARSAPAEEASRLTRERQRMVAKLRYRVERGPTL